MIHTVVGAVMRTVVHAVVHTLVRFEACALTFTLEVERLLMRTVVRSVMAHTKKRT